MWSFLLSIWIFMGIVLLAIFLIGICILGRCAFVIWQENREIKEAEQKWNGWRRKEAIK